MTKGNDQRRLRWLDLPHESVKRGTQKGILSLSLSFSLSLLVKSDAYLTLCYTISNVLSNEFYCFIEHGESNEILVGYFIVEVVARWTAAILNFQENWDMRSGVSKFFEVGEVR